MLNVKNLPLLLRVIAHPNAFGRLVKDSIGEFGRNELLYLANRFHTDKGIPHHNYVRVYNALFHDKREHIKTFCELGLLCHKYQNGIPGTKSRVVYKDTPSLRMWKAYFPRAKIIGFDLQEFKRPDGCRLVVIQGDQKRRCDLSKIIAEEKVLDVVLDDALHASEHQQVSFSFLFPHVKSGGYYVIEDLKFQPEKYEKSTIPRTYELLKKLQNNGKWHSPKATQQEKEYVEKNVESVQFFDSLYCREPSDSLAMNESLAIIRKK